MNIETLSIIGIFQLMGGSLRVFIISLLSPFRSLSHSRSLPLHTYTLHPPLALLFRQLFLLPSPQIAVIRLCAVSRFLIAKRQTKHQNVSIVRYFPFNGNSENRSRMNSTRIYLLSIASCNRIHVAKNKSNRINYVGVLISIVEYVENQIIVCIHFVWYCHCSFVAIVLYGILLLINCRRFAVQKKMSNHCLWCFGGE